jgi:hypothetical protein
MSEKSEVSPDFHLQCRWAFEEALRSRDADAHVREDREVQGAQPKPEYRNARRFRTILS